MWKSGISVVTLFVVGFKVASGLFGGGSWSSQGDYSHLPLEEEIVKAAEQLNEKRGQVTGNTTFTGASAHGATLIYDYTIDNAPERFDTSAATDHAQALAERKACSGPLTPALRRGATIVFRYSSDTGRDLFEARVNATICRLGS